PISTVGVSSDYGSDRKPVTTSDVHSLFAVIFFAALRTLSVKAQNKRVDEWNGVKSRAAICHASGSGSSCIGLIKDARPGKPHALLLQSATLIERDTRSLVLSVAD